MKTPIDPKLYGLVRHALTFAGGLLVARGTIDQETANALAGALVTIIGAVMSYRAPEKRR